MYSLCRVELREERRNMLFPRFNALFSQDLSDSQRDVSHFAKKRSSFMTHYVKLSKVKVGWLIPFLVVSLFLFTPGISFAATHHQTTHLSSSTARISIGSCPNNINNPY